MNLEEFAALSLAEQIVVLETSSDDGIKCVYFDGDELDRYSRAFGEYLLNPTTPDKAIMDEIEATIQQRIAAMREIHEAKLNEKNQPALFDTEIDFRKTKKVPVWVRNLFNEKLAIEETTAQQRGDVGYMARALVQATLPYKDPCRDVYTRVNGSFQLRVYAGVGGIPYGVYPRLLMSWVATEAVRTKSPNLILGETLASFMKDVMEIRSRSGGARGSARRAVDQMKRLFTSHIDAIDVTKTRKLHFQNLSIVESLDLDEQEVEDSILWTPQAAHEAGEWRSRLRLSEHFFQALRDSPVPIDLKAYKALRGSPMAMDIYSWTTYRAFYLREASKPIPWDGLFRQFGTGYASVRDFKKAFLRGLDLVRIVYADVAYEAQDDGLVLLPTLPHIQQKQKPLF